MDDTPQDEAGSPTLNLLIADLTEAQIYEEGGETKIKGSMSTIDAIVFFLYAMANNIKQQEARDALYKMGDYLKQHIQKIRFDISETGIIERYIYDFKWENATETQQDVKKQLDEYLNSEHVLKAIEKMHSPKAVDEALKLIKTARETQEENKKLKKQLKKNAKGKTRTNINRNVLENVLKTPPIQVRKKSAQMSIFDSLEPELQKEIIEALDGRTQLHIDMINSKGQGIKLSNHETKMIIVINELFQDKSQHNDTTRADYMIGNITKEEDIKWATYGQAEDTDDDNLLIKPQYYCTLREVAQKFTGKIKPSTDDIKNILNIIKRLSEDPDTLCALTWSRTTGNKINITREYKHLISYQLHEQKNKDTGQTTKKDITITLHPIFRHKLENNFAELPRLQDIIEVNGSSKLPKILSYLIFEIIMKLSRQHKKYKIGQERLLEKIAPDYMTPPKRRPKQAILMFQKEVEKCKKLKILDRLEEEPAADGGINYVFYFPINRKKPTKTG